MKKLATKTSAFRAADGKLYDNQATATIASAEHKLADLVRRINVRTPSQPMYHRDSQLALLPGQPKDVLHNSSVFLTASSWFKENPELVAILTHYDPESKELQTKPSDYANYLKTRIKRGAAWESYDKWKDRMVVAQAGTGLGLVSAPDEQKLAEVDKLIADGTLPVKTEDTRPEKSVLGNVDKSDSRYPA